MYRERRASCIRDQSKFSKFGIEWEVYDFEGRQTYRNCLSRKPLKNESFSNNFADVSIQNVLLEELFSGLPVLPNCVKNAQTDFITLKLKFSQQSKIHGNVRYDFESSSSLQSHKAFNFLTCDGVRQKVDFMGYLEPFDAKSWIGTLTSLFIYSIAMAIVERRSSNSQFADCCFSSFLMHLSFLTGVANIPHKFMVNNQLSTVRILMVFWGIATIVLCSLYSSLVTSNVIALISLVSPWTEYKQLEKFTKVFGLNSQQEMFRMDSPL
jgi:hypothetical protein